MPRTSKLKAIVKAEPAPLEPPRERDPFDISLREFLISITQRGVVDDWINIRGNNYPWRHIVRAADRGECKISRVGRKLMMRRDELDRWLVKQSMAPRKRKSKGHTAPADDLDAEAQRLLEKQGYRF